MYIFTFDLYDFKVHWESAQLFQWKMLLVLFSASKFISLSLLNGWNIPFKPEKI